MPELLRHVDDRTERGRRTRVGHHQVEVAEALRDRGDGGGHLTQSGHVGRNRERATPGVGHLGDDVVERLRASARDGDRRARRCVGPRDRGPDTRTAAGDERDPAREIDHGREPIGE